ncbi:MAG: AAA family ATPase, partial [Bacteroidota bacterium]
MSLPQPLPLGMQDFRSIVEGGYLYVDKTVYLHRLQRLGKYFFLSRPRRFGKSLNLSVIAALYRGERELFRGLYIEDKWDWNVRHPVIRLNLTALGVETLGLEAALVQELHTLAEARGIQLTKTASTPLFRELIEKTANGGKVVVLIDEYDAPIIQYLGKDLARAMAHRDSLREFYAVLKKSDAALAFLFITGVSKFSKVGIFSGMNNLTDITGTPQFATMLGYTQTELEQYFVGHIQAAAEAKKMTTETLLTQLREWYNGYRFNSEGATVYNPVSLHLFFTNHAFNNYWFETGTPTFLIDLLKQNGLYKFNLEPKTPLEFESFELDNIHPYGLLYQAGYLTIDHVDEFGLYHLDYPNYEVENAMLAYLLEAFGGVSKGSGQVVAIRLEQALVANDVEQAVRILQRVFKGIPYPLHAKQSESFYHAAVHLLFAYVGLRVQSEVCTSDGRVDCVVETPDRIYIFEFQLDQKPAQAL